VSFQVGDRIKVWQAVAGEPSRFEKGTVVLTPSAWKQLVVRYDRAPNTTAIVFSDLCDPLTIVEEVADLEDS
jgi:hypothetical protein